MSGWRCRESQEGCLERKEGCLEGQEGLSGRPGARLLSCRLSGAPGRLSGALGSPKTSAGATFGNFRSKSSKSSKSPKSPKNPKSSKSPERSEDPDRNISLDMYLFPFLI